MFTTGVWINIDFVAKPVLQKEMELKQGRADAVPILKLAQVTAASNKWKKKHWHWHISGQTVF